MGNKQTRREDTALSAVPNEERQHWIVPATVFGGLEFAVPVIMVGASLAGSFRLSTIFWIIFLGLILIQWAGNALQGFLGAKTGRSSSVIARTSFGSVQARFIVGLALVVLNVGWFGVNTAVAGDAVSAIFGINNQAASLFITLIVGLLFALPAILGYNSMKWTDYLAVPAGLILIGSAVFFALKDKGLEAIFSWHPEPSMSFFSGVSLVLGANVAQWLIASDYTRYSKPRIKDQILSQLGIVVVGFVFFFTGSIMSVGVGEADIVKVMQQLGFPFWGFLILWLALWTSQIVASYSTGLAAANMCNINSGKGRSWLTFAGSLIGIVLALLGILNYFTDFLVLLAVIYPAIAGIMFSDFLFIRKGQWIDNKGWNWTATIALVIGIFIGYLTQYVYPFGIPAVQSLLVSGIIYLVAMEIKRKVMPDHFTKNFSDKTINMS